MWTDALGPNSQLQQRSPSPSGAASGAASGAVAGASGGACAIYGLKNAALYQPPPVAFGSSFGKCLLVLNLKYSFLAHLN